MARESLRIGDEAVGAIFGRITDIGVAPTGDIYVADNMNHQIWMFSPDGQPLGRFGRRGAGPGEFRGSLDLRLAIADDTVFVLDTYIHAFRPNGDFLYTTRLFAQNTDSYFPTISAVSTSAGLIAAWDRPSSSSVKEGEYKEDTISVRTRPRNAENFAEPEYSFAGEKKFKVGPNYYVTERFGSTPALAIAPNGHLFYSQGDKYSIEQLDHNGALVARLTGNLTQIRIPASVAESVREESIDRSRKQPLPEGADRAKAQNAIRLAPTATHRPVIGRLIAGDSGLLLVERRDIESDDGGVSSNWDVIRVSTHQRLGRLKLPLWFTPLLFREWRLYGVDSRIVPRVVRLDIGSEVDGK